MVTFRDVRIGRLPHIPLLQRKKLKSQSTAFSFPGMQYSKAEVIKRTYGEMNKVANPGCSDSIDYPNPERSAQRGNCTKAAY